MRIMQKGISDLYHAELSDGRFMHVTTEVAEEYLALQEQVEELREDIDFLCTWCSYSTLDENDPHLQHHQNIIKRWEEREQALTSPTENKEQ